MLAPTLKILSIQISDYYAWFDTFSAGFEAINSIEIVDV